MKTENKNWQELARTIIGDSRFGDHNVVPIYPHRVLLWSEATGTGKSTLPMQLLAHRDPVRVMIYKSMDEDRLVGPTQLRDGSTVDMPQLAATAMMEGRPLLLDEVDQYGPSVETYLHAILDDLDLALLTLPNGTEIKPRDGYCVVGTTNARPEALPERLLHRFDAIIHADSASQGIIDSLPPAIGKMLTGVMHEERFFAPVTTRRCIALHRFIAGGMDQRDAIRYVFGTDDTLVDAMESALAANSVSE